MNREILFRGKRIDNGEWVEGDGIHYPKSINYKGTCWIDGMHERANDWVQVIHETLGRYTGLTDKNGRRIFEGDIIKTKKYGRDTGRLNVNDFDIFIVIYEPCSFFLDNKNRRFALADDGFSKFEIIGNIHDGGIEI